MTEDRTNGIVDDEDRPTAETPEGGEGRPETPEGGERPKQQSLARWLLETLALVGLAFVLSLGIRTYLMDTRIVPTGSMEPTIPTGSRVLDNRLAYRIGEPKRGDIVVFQSWKGGEPDLLKRVVAVAGDRVAMDGQGRFTVNGEPLLEPYITPQNRITTPGPILPYEVAEGEIFVMGDNRNNSSDSRFNGPVKVDRVLGKVFAIYWPPSKARIL